ncbi:hypothetical protein FZW96_17970 [Bacillus sp. BGMRC 2118]|nr:hypothetical protein FZW96_17970 [Bacillus sp. BGMRC 2118]
MVVAERNKESKIIVIGGIILFIGIILAILFPAIQDSYLKFSIQDKKEESTITRSLTKDEVYQLERQQRDLAKQFEKEYDWLYDEIKNSSLKILSTYDFMHDHPEYDQIKVTFPITTYRVNGETVTFISNEGTISQVHTSSGWENK